MHRQRGVGLGGISQLLKYVRECGASGARVVFFNQPLFFAGGLHPTIAAQIRELAVSNGLALVVSVETRMTFANNKAEADPFTALYGGKVLKDLKESVDGLALFIPNNANTHSALVWKPRDGEVENWGVMDLSNWLTKNQVAAELGCSTKTVERHAERRAARSLRNALRTRAKSASGGAD